MNQHRVYEGFSSSLKTETMERMENLDEQAHEQDKLRQNARTMLSLLQRTKAQLIELRPTNTGEGEQKLKVRFVSLPSIRFHLGFHLENR